MNKIYNRAIGDLHVEAAYTYINGDEQQLFLSVGLGDHSENRPFIAVNPTQIAELITSLSTILSQRVVCKCQALEKIIGKYLCALYEDKYREISAKTAVVYVRHVGQDMQMYYLAPQVTEFFMDTNDISRVTPKTGMATFEEWGRAGYPKGFGVLLAYAKDIDTVYWSTL